MPKTISLEIPEAIAEHHGSVDELERSLFEDISISEFQKGNLSIRDNAQFWGLTYEGFIEFLGKRKISFINATKEELEESYRHFETFMHHYPKP